MNDYEKSGQCPGGFEPAITDKTVILNPTEFVIEPKKIY